MGRQVEATLQSAAASLKLPPWPAAATAACPAAEQLLARRFGKLCRLLSGLAAFADCLPATRLQALALQRLIPQVRSRVCPTVYACSPVRPPASVCRLLARTQRIALWQAPAPASFLR